MQVKEKRKSRKIKNRFKINKLFLYTISNFLFIYLTLLYKD